MASPSIASATDRVRITPQGVLRLLGMLGVLLFLIVPHLCYRAVGRPSPMVMAFLNAVGWLGGLRIRTTGKRLKRNVLFAANHVSWLDIMALGGAARSSFVAKSEVRDTPLVGWLSDQNHSVYVERAAKRDAHAQAQSLHRALHHGRPVTLFPEGTTWTGREILPFRASLFQAVAPPPPGVRIQPVLLDYGDVGPEICWIGEETGLANFFRVLARLRNIPLTIHYLDPLPFDTVHDRKAIAEACRSAILHRMVAVGLC
ncbi:MAG: lysophospholipid acyltransferase family protein [Sphingopyxis sp.]|nr:lysophospholipid acyltransferase family protein [Sphingopyxis sp.]